MWKTSQKRCLNHKEGRLIEFINKPYLPEKEVTLSVIDKNFNNNQDLINAVRTTELKNVLNGINTHPDMCVCPLGGNLLVLEPTVYNYYYDLLKNYGFNLIKGESILSKEYPYDIAYNCVIINGILFHKLSHTDKKIIEYADKFNIKKVNVKQGYTKCSIAIVTENALITDDIGIYNSIGNLLDVLLIEKGQIELKGYNYGFIGGASGKINYDALAFYGNLKAFNYNDKIISFCKNHGVYCYSLSNQPLYDYGSLLPIIET